MKRLCHHCRPASTRRPRKLSPDRLHRRRSRPRSRRCTRQWLGGPERRWHRWRTRASCEARYRQRPRRAQNAALLWKDSVQREGVVDTRGEGVEFVTRAVLVIVAEGGGRGRGEDGQDAHGPLRADPGVVAPEERGGEGAAGAVRDLPVAEPDSAERRDTPDVPTIGGLWV